LTEFNFFANGELRNFNYMIKITAILSAVVFFANITVFAQADKQQLYKFEQVLNAVSESYADSINQEELTEDAIKALLKDLDPHSLYFSKDEIEELNRGLRGSFTGIGISYDIIRDTVMILKVIKNGPSEKAGLKAGDRILKINDKNIAGNGIDDEILKNLLQGENGTKVNITVKRFFSEHPLTFTVTRGKIPVKSITAAYKTDDNICYIKLNRFSATTINEFKKASDSLLSGKDAKLILDLRYNSGGYLYVALQLLEYFFDKNTLVLYTEGVHQNRADYFTHKKGKYRNTDLAILINESSASASEIVSGAVQDLDRGIIIGRRSYGKGLVQKPFYLIDGSMIRLTVAKYYTPSGRNIQKSYAEGSEDYNNELIRRYEHGEYTNKDSIKFDDSLKFRTLKNKRTVYGGGGIMPDIFIPEDTVNYPDYFKEKLNGGKISEFIHLYAAENRHVLKNKFKDAKKFDSGFIIPENIIKDLIDYVYEDEIKKNDYLNEFKNNVYIKTYIKALTANDLWGNTAYYEILNKKDAAFIKASEVLNNKREYAEILKPSKN